MFKRWIQRARNVVAKDRGNSAFAGCGSESTDSPKDAVRGRRELACTSTPRVLVVSSAGVHNHGDDAILLSTLQRLQRLRPGCEAIVVTDADGVPDLGGLGVWAGTCRQFCASLSPKLIQTGCYRHKKLGRQLPVWVESRGDLTATPRPVRMTSFDTVLLCGGGNLTHHFPPAPACRTAVAAAACATGTPYIVSGQGIGPVDDDVVEMLSLLTSNAVRFGVRDPLSLDLLREIGLSGPNVSVVGDDALGLLVETPEKVRARMAAAGVPANRPVLGFHVREAHYVNLRLDELRAFSRRIDAVAAGMGMTVAAIPINTDVHRPEVQLLTNLAENPEHRALWRVVDAGEDAPAIAGVVKACTAVVTCSFHVALFALESRIPALFFVRTEYYRRKSDGVRAAFRLPTPVTLTVEDDAAIIAARLKQLQQQAWSPLVDGDKVDRWLDDAMIVAEGRSRLRA